MKRLLANGYLVLLLRIILGCVFIVASVEKTANPASFVASIGYYRLVSFNIATVMATVLPWIELLCGLALLFGLSVRGSALLSLIMLLIFTGAVTSAVLRGLDISCGCFTQDPSVGKVGWMKVGENVLLIVASAFLLVSTSVRFSIEGYFQRLFSGANHNRDLPTSQ
jgi:uncharacterized membrane protein YphA (DoxX/SURF4 family)